MIAFRSMTEEEYPAFLNYFISDYAVEIESNYRLSPADAHAKASNDIAESLPEGVKTPGQVLLCLVEQSDHSNTHIGYLWYKPDSAMTSAFIYDFHIFESCQGLGLGKQSLRDFEEYLREKGFKEVRLRVAGDNVRARHIYESSGFGVTGVNMSKVLVD